MALSDIAVRVEPSAEPEQSGWVRALLAEIEMMLGRLLEQDDTATPRDEAIELQALPLAPSDIERLREALGRGELEARLIDQSGPATIYETGFAGIWWVTLEDLSGRRLSEQIQIAEVPPLLRAHREDMLAARERLRELVESDGLQDSR